MMIVATQCGMGVNRLVLISQALSAMAPKLRANISGFCDASANPLIPSSSRTYIAGLNWRISYIVFVVEG